MKTLVLDSNAVIALFDGDRRVADLLSESEQILLPVVALAEIRMGINGTKRGKATEAALERFLDRDNVSLLDVTSETASFFVTVVRYLKSAGHPIPTNDVWIAAGALERGGVLLTRDAHFAHLPMLRLAH